MPILYLSICIPTNGRIEILRNTLDSIYKDCEVPFSEFEVVLSDNSKNDDLDKLLKDYFLYPNLIHKKTQSKGFLNSINALKLGKGSFLKLHNNYTMFTKRGFFEFIELIKNEYYNKPFIFFRNSGQSNSVCYNSFNQFNYDLSFWNSWSSGFSIWKEDFNKILNIEVNKMFPHTTLFLSQHYKDKFILSDQFFFINQDVTEKGGYNLFRTFAVEYLFLMQEANYKKIISNQTYNKIKKDLFYNFLTIWYCKTRLMKNEYTFQLSGIKESLKVNYGFIGFYKLLFFSFLEFFKIKIIKIIKKYYVK